VIDALA
jgi:ABC-type nitrate/sulfonate/bicarbonate transport system substrate-binding protein